MSLPTGADVVIVGSGMAGLAVADELRRRSDAAVMLLESGPYRGHAHIGSTSREESARRLWLSPASDPCFWRSYATPGPHYLGLAGLRRRVGGRSLYWGGTLLPIEDWALHSGAWPKAVLSDLVTGWDGGTSLYSIVRGEIAAWVGASALCNGASGLTIASRHFSPTPQAVRRESNGRWAAFSPLAAPVDSNEDSGARSHFVCFAPDGRPIAGCFSPAESARFAQGTSKLPPVAIWSGCHVLGVTVRSGKAIGVRVRQDNDVREIRAANVVLAAGTIENSRLAIQALVDAGQFSDLKLTGLVDKIVHGFILACPARDLPPDMRSAAEEGSTFHQPLGEPLRSNHFVRLATTDAGLVVMDTWLMGEQVSSSAGEVRCHRSPEWPWATEVLAGLGPDDESLCEAQKIALAGFWRECAELFGMTGTNLQFEPSLGSPDLPARLLAPFTATERFGPVCYSFPLGSEQHEASTTPLGSLLDNHHEFRSLSGLVAAGPSAFPRTGAANPALTILALGKRLGRELIRRSR